MTEKYGGATDTSGFPEHLFKRIPHTGDNKKIHSPPNTELKTMTDYAEITAESLHDGDPYVRNSFKKFNCIKAEIRISGSEK